MGELLSQYDVLGAFLVNIELTLWAAIGSAVLGVVLMVMRVSPISSLRSFAAAFVNIVMNVPLTLIILACSLGVYGELGVVVSGRSGDQWLARNSFWLTVIGLSVYTSTFVCEALRSGLNTVPPGQAEAARAIGLSFGQTMRSVILPQTLRGAVAPLGNTLIALAKNTTVASAAGVAQAASVMSDMFEFDPQHLLAIFAIFAIGWTIIVLPIGLITTSLSRKLAVAR
ncbi:amino acid ABC transporter permease [Actinomyces haliotis]|uniref:amino acid ABC transporter permease n=1 Tax=Actinomyces haliotis TaxID=1280843 RepID=UPI00188EC7FA|nr:ABC transporter permease subunit [Actinomyces haliotis]